MNERKKINVANTQSGVDVTAHMADTYARPSVAGPSQLESIAETLTDINPKIGLYLNQRQEKKDNYDVLVGQQLYRRLLSDGRDRSLDEINEMVKNGEVDGFGKLSRMQKQGIIQARYEHLGNTIGTEMLKWYANATTKDENGNDIPLSEMKDQKLAMTLFEQEAEKKVLNMTKGKYDAQMYDEYVSKPLASARNQFIMNNTSQYLAKQDSELKQGAITLMADSIAPIIKNSGFIREETKAASIQQGADAVKNQIAFMMNKGLSKNDAFLTASQWLQGMMSNSDLSGDDRRGIWEIAKTIPELINDPKQYDALNNAFNSGENTSMTLKYKRDSEKREQEELEVEDWFSSVVSRGLDKIPVNELYATLNKYSTQGGKIYSLYNSYNNAKQIMFDSTITMPPERYQAILDDYRRGGGSRTELMSMAGSLDSQQWRELNGEYEDTVRLAKANYKNKLSQAREAKASKEKGFRKVALATAPLDKQKMLKDASSEGADYLVNTVSQNIRLAYAVFKQKNPNASKEELEYQSREIGRNEWAKYKDNIDTFIQHPEVVGAKQQEISAVEARDSYGKIKGSLKQGYNEKDFKNIVSHLDTGVTPDDVKWLKKNVDPRSPVRGNPEEFLKSLSASIQKAKEKKK